MSALRSPLKSPTPAICQSSVGEPGEPKLLMVSPFISQMMTSPEVLRHRMSASPSPLKSPTPAICQSLVGVPGEPKLLMASPFISQMTTSPDALRHRMSALRSPLKSPQHSSLATTASEAQFCNGCAAAVLVSPAAVVAPSTVQMRYARTLLSGKPLNVSEVPGESLTAGRLGPVP